MKTMKMWGYRVLENDEDGDPVDHGVVVAYTITMAKELVAARLRHDLDFSGTHTVRLYPTAMPSDDHEAVLESYGYDDVTVTP